jgi:hypothetical protein
MNAAERVEPRPTPAHRADCRLSNLVYCGGRRRCYFPSKHNGACGVQPWEPARGPQWYWRLLAWFEGAL